MKNNIDPASLARRPRRPSPLRIFAAGAVLGAGVGSLAATEGPNAVEGIAHIAFAPTPNIAKGPHKVVVVNPQKGLGTEWQIAQAAVGPEGDPRPVVDEIEQALGSTAVQPGERVQVPENSRIGKEVQ